MAKKEDRSWHNHLKLKFFALLVSMLLVLLIYPYLQGSTIGNRIMILLFSLIGIAGVYAASYSKRYFITALILGVPFVLLSWVEAFIQNEILQYVILGIAFIFYLFTIYIVLRYILHRKRVTSDTIYGGICVYLLLGIMWAALYSLLEAINPGSFGTVQGVTVTLTSWSDFLYFSFVTLTTLGYGDIMPISHQAQSLALLEAVIGVLYLTVLIARLVSIYTSQSRKST